MQETGMIFDFELIQVSEVKNSNAMEKEGLIRTINRLIDFGCVIDTIATDRHVQIKCLMRDTYEDIKHQYDVWHVAKSIRKKLAEKGRTKATAELIGWIQCISNHLWNCSQHCEGSASILKERWLSLLHHITGEHEWKEGEETKTCGHAAYSPEQNERKKWINPTSKAYRELESVVLDKGILDSLSGLTDFCHTGNIESYHSMMLQYCPKRLHFPYKSMLARTQLAAIDHNSHIGRGQMVASKGPNKGSLMYSQAYSKMCKSWSVRPVFEKKTYSFVSVLMDRVVKCKRDGLSLPPCAVPTLPANIAPIPKPQKSQAILRHSSRF
ncbi:uncharacterized protein LOC117101089 [Anneissia japonica]|uniref:uncharacterized protein LOC117101089 n=1 Tax=Anneissia japonica TaxID=1529436 RepID=UPI001425A088|nr:uncharacterized protein LOC117101089 [Anneissia japonica]